VTGPGRPRAGGAAALALIRISLLLGVLLFGAVTWFIHRDATRQPSDPELVAALRRAMLAAWGLAIVALLALRPRIGRLTGGAHRSLLVIAWAIGEAAALFGGVHYFLSGDARSFLGGLIVMLGAFLLYPVRRE
jgi:hypothetical protein